ncbi:uncharacterized protein LOC116896302 isoform X2 [Rattus rattus]|uniref:uncharacterized protein LOC116896302 isoform X2 n=1 Tax=Rattus rattus TaxID=10117 RepID=UPI0013F39A9B|nr:uncharacterized protein LOC116896302 isoform X2 [Rattus rattus]
MARRLRLAAPGAAARPRRSLAGATEVPGVTGPERRRNGRSGPAASVARAGRERPPDTAVYSYLTWRQNTMTGKQAWNKAGDTSRQKTGRGCSVDHGLELLKTQKKENVERWNELGG